MRKINKIFIHHSASTFGDVEIIDKWHKERGFDEIGYHFVILTNGFIEFGRDLNKVGAHVKGHNTGSIGICMIHDKDQIYSVDQIISAFKLSAHLCREFNIKIENILGHCEVDSNKPDCPGYSMKNFRAIANKFKIDEKIDFTNYYKYSKI